MTFYLKKNILNYAPDLRAVIADSEETIEEYFDALTDDVDMHVGDIMETLTEQYGVIYTKENENKVKSLVIDVLKKRCQKIIDKLNKNMAKLK